MPQEQYEIFRCFCFCAARGNCDGLRLQENTETDDNRSETPGTMTGFR